MPPGGQLVDVCASDGDRKERTGGSRKVLNARDEL
jgi:hypothetical protein